MRNQKMPDQCLKGFRVRSYGRRTDYGNQYAGVGNLRGVAAIAADNTANSGVHFTRIVQRAHKVGADVFCHVSAADGEDKNHVVLTQMAASKPVRITSLPTIVVYASCQLGNIVRRCVCFDLGDFAEIANRMRGMARTSTDAKEKEPPGALPELKEKVGRVLDG